MRKIIAFGLLLISQSTLAQSDMPRFVEATIVLKDLDTVLSKIWVSRYLNINKVQPVSVVERVLLLSDEGERVEKISSKDIGYLTFIDLDSSEREFVSDGSRLMEIIYNGSKVKWIRKFSHHPYDRSIVSRDYLIDANDKEYFLGILSRPRERLLELTKSKPELATEIKRMKLTDDNIYELLIKFDN